MEHYNTIVEIALYFTYAAGQASTTIAHSVHALPSPAKRIVFFCRAFLITHNERVRFYFDQGCMSSRDLGQTGDQTLPREPRFTLQRARVDRFSLLVDSDWRSVEQIFQEMVALSEQDDEQQ